MINLIRAEVYKLGKSTGIKICLLLSFISAVSLITISHLVATGKMSAEVTGSASGLTEIMIVSLLGSFMAGGLICNDFETKTIHDAVACGKGRISLVISKVLMYVFVIALLMIPYVAATIFVLCKGMESSMPFVASTFTGILTEASGKDVTAAVIGRVVIISIVTILIHAARLSICIPFAFKVRKQVVVMAVGFAASGLIDLVIGLINDSDIVRYILSVTPYSREYLVIGLDTATGVLLKGAVSSIVFISIMTVLTYTLFKRAEIK